jgi:hypothetical protein
VGSCPKRTIIGSAEVIQVLSIQLRAEKLFRSSESSSTRGAFGVASNTADAVGVLSQGNFGAFTVWLDLSSCRLIDIEESLSL